MDSIFDGLVVDNSHSDLLSFDLFLRYVKTLSKIASEPPPNGFDDVKRSLRLPETAPLVRTEELVQSQTATLPMANGTLFLTDAILIHQVAALHAFVWPASFLGLAQVQARVLAQVLWLVVALTAHHPPRTGMEPGLGQCDPACID